LSSAEQLFHVRVGSVATGDPDNLGRGAESENQFDEIVILCDDGCAFLASDIEDFKVASVA
jgi:hypothetical protein